MIFTGHVNPGGYGVIKSQGAMHNAHRVAYEVLVGPIPEGMHIDHLCRVRRCVNPHHLEPVTQRENTLRGDGPTAIHALKTHCPQGHPYDEVNTYVCSAGRRHCRKCKREREREYRAAHRPGRTADEVLRRARQNGGVR
ncbi:HNH endonuclease signature motif containing protein [Streptomyces griseoincarnatus]